MKVVSLAEGFRLCVRDVGRPGSVLAVDARGPTGQIRPQDTDRKKRPSARGQEGALDREPGRAHRTSKGGEYEPTKMLGPRLPGGRKVTL